ncbi:MAG: HDOD domain-containing protein [bacterium]|nr:HDOD domain-containing protein [bacterium]
MLATLADEDVSFAKLAELIEKDTVLAGNVLRLVNSALYGRRGTISSVRHAVSLIGVVKLRNSAMTLSISNMWSDVKTPSGWSSPRFNLHAVATAIMADLLAQKVPVEYPEGAFVAGLLHDIGLLLIATALPDQYEEIRRRHDAEDQPLDIVEREVLGVDHAELSACALAEWNIPEPIQKAVRYHHRPQRQTGDEIPLSRLLRAAEDAVDHQGITVLGNTVSDEEAAESPFEQIGIGDQTQKILDEFNPEFDSIRAFF